MRNRHKASLAAAVVTAILAFPAVAAQTAAPPELQETIRHVFPQSPGCGASRNFKVVSSDLSPDAKVEAGALTVGEIDEVWQAVTCSDRTRVRYLFRMAPDGQGKLTIVGFERVAAP